MTLPILGWRIWEISLEGELKARNIPGVPWKQKIEKARCERERYRLSRGEGDFFVLDNHDSPEESCTCGLYANHAIPTIWGQHDCRAMKCNPQHHQASTLTMGLVRGWGKVLVHQKCWRSEEMEIIALVASGPEVWLPKARLAAQRYQVPMWSVRAAKTHAEEHGQFISKWQATQLSIEQGEIVVPLGPCKTVYAQRERRERDNKEWTMHCRHGLEATVPNDILVDTFSTMALADRLRADCDHQRGVWSS